MTREKLTRYLISSHSTVVEAMEKIDKHGKGILFVVNEDEQLCGSLTVFIVL